MNGSCLVLIYHRVLDLKNDPQLLCVTPENFEKQIIWLKENFKIISLSELVKKIKEKKLDDKYIAITFDDGYFDNLYYAKPILEKHKVPATIFVSTGLIGKNQEFWWDELERLFLANENILNKTISFLIEDNYYEWIINSKEKAESTYKELHPILKYLKHSDRDRILNEIFYQLGIDRNIVRESHRILNEKELEELSESDYIEIGAHTVNHCVLSMEDIPTREYEINESKIYLESITCKSITSFSYPFGTKNDYSINTIETIIRAGFKYAIANNQGIVTNNTNLFEIPRFLIRNWETDIFVEKINTFCKSQENNIIYPENQENKKSFIKRVKNKIFSLLKIKFFINKIKNKLLSKIKNEELVKLNEELSINSKRQNNIDEYLKNKYYNQLLNQIIIKKSFNYISDKKEIKNILQINTNDKKGGAAKITYTLHKKYLEKGLKSKILCRNKTDDEDFIYKISQHNDFLQSTLFDIQDKHSYLDFFHLSSSDIKEYYIFKNSDILHLHNLHGNYFSLFALPELSHLKPTVWTLHDMQSFTGHCAHSFNCERWMKNCGNCPDLTIYPSIKNDKTAFILKNKKIIYENSKLTIVCPSIWLKNKVEKSILKIHDVRLIYNGIDTNKFNKKDKKAIRSKLNLPQYKTILLFSADNGLNNPWKGSNFIFESYKYFSNFSDLLFINIGGSNKSTPKNNWLDIEYIKNDELMSDYYAASDLFIYPSLADNCPLVVMEALSCGLPVVTFETGGIPELVKHLETGYVAKYKDLNDFINGVKMFISNKELINKTSNTARDYAVSNFDTSKMVEEYLKLYEEIVKK